MGWKRNRYNKKSSAKFGWHPSWFAQHLKEFNDELATYVQGFQFRHSLETDGYVGPVTYRRMVLSSELQEEKTTNYILINGKRRPIDWDVKIDLIKPGAYKKVRNERKPSMVVTHWDVCTSAEKCKRVLEARDISTHFCIDNDGVIYQFLDTNDIGWHAGNRTVNNKSIGVDFSNAYYLKYNPIYEKRGFSPRPVLKNSIVHGVKLRPHLGYYKVQIEAYKKLLSVICPHYDISFSVPEDGDGNLLTAVHKDSAKGRFNGVVCHYHLTRNKIDTAGLKLKEIVDSLG
tara:strand:- start:8416 stop:9276 length:861 start_codon:yes stop_codon:yes gene_type:complete